LIALKSRFAEESQFQIHPNRLRQHLIWAGCSTREDVGARAIAGRALAMIDLEEKLSN
jgi:hypothetical protein